MFMSARSVFVVLVCVSLGVLWSGRDSAVESADYAAAQGSLTAGTQAGVKSGVYAVMLAGALHHNLPGSGMLVRDELIPIRAISAAAVPEYLKKFDPVPTELRNTLRGPTVSRPAPVDRSLFPAGTQFISQAALTAAFNESLGGGWRSFRRQVQLRWMDLLLGRISDGRRPRCAGVHRSALRRSVRPGKLQLAASDRIGSAVVDHENDCQLGFMKGRRFVHRCGPARRDKLTSRFHERP